MWMPIRGRNWNVRQPQRIGAQKSCHIFPGLNQVSSGLLFRATALALSSASLKLTFGRALGKCSTLAEIEPPPQASSDST